MKAILLSILSLLLMTCTGWSQEQLYASKKKTIYKDTTQNHYFIHTSYWAPYVFHPGINAGISIPIRKRIIQRKVSLLHREWIALASLGGYYFRQNHSAASISIELNRRIISTKHMVWGYGVGIGFQRSMLPKTYEVLDDGSVKSVPFPGRSYLNPTASAYLGFQKTARSIHYEPFIKPSLHALAPNNTSFTMSVLVELGVRFQLKQTVR